MLDTIMGQIGPRLREPSTFVGAATFILQAVGWGTLAPDLAGPISMVLAGAASIALVLIREARHPKEHA